MCFQRKETTQLPDLIESPGGMSSGPIAKIPVHLDEQGLLHFKSRPAGSGGEERGGGGVGGAAAGVRQESRAGRAQ